MKVRDDVAKTVTTDAFTWKTVKAYGTVDGEFSYITADVPTDLSHAAALSGNPEWQKTLAFGNNADITEWVSNEVRVLLKRTDMTKPSGSITPGDLNTEDHFAYVIGYKDGNVRPYGLIPSATSRAPRSRPSSSGCSRTSPATSTGPRPTVSPTSAPPHGITMPSPR